MGDQSGINGQWTSEVQKRIEVANVLDQFINPLFQSRRERESMKNRLLRCVNWFMLKKIFYYIRSESLIYFHDWCT